MSPVKVIDLRLMLGEYMVCKVVFLTCPDGRTFASPQSSASHDLTPLDRKRRAVVHGHNMKSRPPATIRPPSGLFRALIRRSATVFLQLSSRGSRVPAILFNSMGTFNPAMPSAQAVRDSLAIGRHATESLPSLLQNTPAAVPPRRQLTNSACRPVATSPKGLRNFGLSAPS